MINTVIVTLYFFLPAYFANMCPVIFDRLGWLKFLAKPIDGGRTFNGQPLFGANKTWRGLAAGIIGGLIVTALQAFAYQRLFLYNLSLVDYSDVWIMLGILGGGGAILGDLIKSFFKRRVGIKAGGAWPIFDQLDFIAGFIVFTAVIFIPHWSVIITICLLTLLLHPLTNIISYLIGWKKVWW